MTTMANPLRLLLVFVWLLGCTRTTSPDASSSSNWLSCTTLSDCASAPSAVACKQGYCVDAMGQHLVRAVLDEQQAAICTAFADPNADPATFANLVTGAGGTCMLSASDYDQSCTNDSDCVEIGAGNACDLLCTVVCSNAAINIGAQAQYRADFAQTPLGLCTSPSCRCPALGFPRCNGGQCELSSGLQPVDAGQ